MFPYMRGHRADRSNYDELKTDFHKKLYKTATKVL